MTYITLLRKLWFLGVIAVVALAAYFSGVHTLIGKAAQMAFYYPTCYTAAATSTLSYMTAGLATTTVTCPMGVDGADTAILTIQVNASSSATTFNIYVEESMDGMDWYPVNNNQGASTSVAFNVGTRPYNTFTFASSTIGGVPLTTGLKGASTTFEGYTSVNNRNHYTLEVPVNMRRVRAYAAIPVGSTAGAVWMQVIPKFGI